MRGFDDFQRLVATAPDRQITITLDREGRAETVTAVPRSESVTDSFGNEHRVGRLGVSNSFEPSDYFLYKPGPIEAVGMTFEEVRFIMDRTVAFLGDFFVGRGDVKQLGGPIKVAQVSQQVSTLGPIALLNLVALLSLNIGLVNLLADPAARRRTPRLLPDRGGARPAADAAGAGNRLPLRARHRAHFDGVHVGQ